MIYCIFPFVLVKVLLNIGKKDAVLLAVCIKRMEIKSADLHVRNLIEVSSFSPPSQSFSVDGTV